MRINAREAIMLLSVFTGLIASWWICTAIVWRYLFSDTYDIDHSPFNLRDFFMLEGMPDEALLGNIMTGILVMMTTSLLIWGFVWSVIRLRRKFISH
jgi:hypothetical protein